MAEKWERGGMQWADKKMREEYESELDQNKKKEDSSRKENDNLIIKY